MRMWAMICQTSQSSDARKSPLELEQKQTSWCPLSNQMKSCRKTTSLPEGREPVHSWTPFCPTPSATQLSSSAAPDDKNMQPDISTHVLL